MTSAWVQYLLEVGPVDDPLEKQADRRAADVVRALGVGPPPTTNVRRSPAPAGGDLPAAGPAGGELDAATASRIRGASGGRPLEAGTRGRFEQAMGEDLSRVRIFRNSTLAPQLGARAFTHGRDVHFAPGEFAPDTPAGQHVLAHELTHVGQQTGTAQRTPDVVRRMPTDKDLIRTLGKPKKGEKESTKYKAVLEKVRIFHFVTAQDLAPTGPRILAQLKELLRQYDLVTDAVSKYVGTFSMFHKKKPAYFQNLLYQLLNEKAQTLGAMMRYAQNPPANPPKLSAVVAGSGSVNASPILPKNQRTGQVGGAMNKLDVYNSPAGGSQYFKPNMSSLDVWTTPEEEQEATKRMREDKQAARSDLEKQAISDAFTAKQNRTDISERAGIDPNDTRTSNREVASYRLDQLLGADIIARTEFAISARGKGAVGSVQQGAGGASIGALGKSKQLDLNDPRLARNLSRLQLLDAIALQADRNLGNMYFDTATGQIYGIDNDMAFGTVDKVGPVKEFPGLAQYFDREMALKVIALAGDPTLVRAALADIVGPAEMTALLARLTKLATHLQDLDAKGQLLQPNEWAGAMAQVQADRKSYLGNI